MKSLTPVICYETGSFPYHTMIDRIPKILTKVIDSLYKYCLSLQDDENLKDKEFSKLNDSKDIISKLSEFKRKLTTCKPYELFTDEYEDVEIWNDALSTSKTYGPNRNCEKSWINLPFLFAECYVYRKLFSFFYSSTHHKDYDYFSIFKKESLDSSMGSIIRFTKLFRNIITKSNGLKLSDLDIILKSCLWGNASDLSISGGVVLPIKDIGQLKFDTDILIDPIIINDINEIYSFLSNTHFGNMKSIHIVLDNVGFETFSDICLSIYLLKCNICCQVILHCKAFPWYVSDATPSDINYMIEVFKESSIDDINWLADTFLEYISNDIIKIDSSIIWTVPCYYNDTVNMDIDEFDLIHNEFFESLLVIFKGDMNYRRLTGDLEWDCETPISQVLGTYNDFNLVSIRTIKSDVVVGISNGLERNLDMNDFNWRYTGEYGMIQLSLSSPIESEHRLSCSLP